MTKPKLIGFAGRARSGKDTAAKWISEHRHYYHYSFAAPIKRAVAAMLDIDLDELERVKDLHIEELGTTPRYMMQTMGTEWGRKVVHPELWVRLAKRELDTLSPKYPGMVISDVRFENEATWIRSEGGSIVHIERPYYLAEIPNPKHSSEHGVVFGTRDVGLRNEGTLEDYLNNISRVFSDA